MIEVELMNFTKQAALDVFKRETALGGNE